MAGTLQDAIVFIKQGRKPEAKRILETLLRANPQNVATWFWYAETLETLEKRLHALELCQKLNPGNPQVERALSTLRSRMSSVPRPPSVPIESKPTFEWDDELAGTTHQDKPLPQKQSAFQWDDESQTPLRVSEPARQPESAFQWDDEPQVNSAPGINWDEIEQQQQQNSLAWEYKPSDVPIETARPKPSYAFYDVWLTALTTQHVGEYAALLEDKDAGQGRAYEWMAYVGLFSGLVLPFVLNGAFNQPEIQPLLGKQNPTLMLIIVTAALTIVYIISSVLGLMINGGLQFLLAKMFGGNGSFSRTVYAIGAYLAPLSFITMVVSLIPFVNCLSIVLSIYGVSVNVRALRAAHQLDTSRAIMVIVLPGILVFTCLCLILMTIWPVLQEALPAYPNGYPSY